MTYIPRIKILYKEKTKVFIDENKYSSSMQIPKLQKIVLNKGIGGFFEDKKMIEHAIEEVSAIAGQRAVICLSKKDEAGFKLRKGIPIGIKVTLRRDKMFEFLDRLITIAIPRLRDFNGISNKGFDGYGNYTMGISEQIIFPEISIEKVKQISGLDITFVTSVKNNKEAFSLLKHLGLPFKNG
ncbi:50S ribosomal protein L5 [Candidatus Uzinura diaspidicola str. ASNER]|uniref:Large ribosomal subunit protein uL5 n=1 Tax=Candidatus Uzinura diaspidicola str. ASNER TaxID=1133592 RepID=L7VMY9_9FLAO|nr:50S ribosomal protein L5 [Candidatus Uzinura diaspidicola str. ASNER]